MIANWLLIVYTYMSSVPDGLWNVIFQHMHGSDVKRAGDGRRAELKGDKWPRPERKDGETRESWLKKLAGFYALQHFYEALFRAIINILPPNANIDTRLYPCMYSILSSDRRTGDVEAQDPHNDKKPVFLERSYSALINLSDVFSYIGILINSCPNIKAMFEYENSEFQRFQQQFSVTKSVNQPGKSLSEVMGIGNEDEKVRIAWGHCFAMHKPKQFKGMHPVYAKMPPIMVALFDTDCVHWGPPYPVPDIEYPMSVLPPIHYR